MIQLFTDNNHFITLQKAKEWIRNFREQKQKVLSPEFSERNILPDSETFNREAIDRLLAQQGCAGIRVYYGMDEALNVHAILVGVNEKNEDMLPAAATTEAALANATEDPVIVEESIRCPPNCPPDSGLYP